MKRKQKLKAGLLRKAVLRKAAACLILTAVFLASYGSGIAAVAKSMQDVEQSTTMKTASPMDAQPDLITLQQGDAVETAQNEYVLSLDGQWEMTSSGTEKGNLTNAWTNVNQVQVPGSISLALWKAGAIEDPYYGKNDAVAREQGQKTWYLRKNFTYNGSGERVQLAFEGVADRCKVYLNGTEVGSHQGMFGGPYIDITSHVKKGENTLMVVLYPVLDYGQTVVFNCSYGWHYANLPPIGIWNSVFVRDLPEIGIDSPFIATVSHEKGTMDLSVDLTAENAADVISGTLVGTVKPKNFEGSAYSFRYTVAGKAAGDRNIRLRFDVPEFRLWWPNGIGDQNLYELKLLFIEDGGAAVSADTSFGIRTLEMDPYPSGESANMYNRTVVINGQGIFMKGAGWCTIDAMMEFEREDYDRILSRAHQQGLNFLRAWGGGMPETDEFYELCDAYGICVYQEWPCCWDSQQRQPADILYETVILNTKRIRNHPSLIIYGGGNEGAAPLNDTVMNQMGKLTYQYDGTRSFFRQDGGPGGAGMSHDHIHWSGASPEHYSKTYANMKNINLHEYGLDSMMNLESIAKFATEEEMQQWPLDPKGTIAYHTATFNGMHGWNPSPHGYDIDTFIHYASFFIEVDSLADLVVGSQLAQTMATYLPIQNARINWPDVTTLAYYKLNDVYPGASWSTVDWYGVPKISHYFCQDANQPLMATGKFDRYNTYDKSSTDFTLPIYVLDDAGALPADGSYTVEVRAYNNMLELVKSEQYQGTGAVSKTKHMGDFYLSAEQTDTAPLFIVIDLIREGQEPIRSYTFMNFDKEQGSLFFLPRTHLEYHVSGNTYTIQNTGTVPAVAVHFTCPSVSDTFVCDDGYFWLEPGETKTVRVNSAEGVEGISAFNIGDASDTAAPSVPGNIKAVSKTFDSITLTWDAAKDNGEISGYYIYLNDALAGYVGGNRTSFTCGNLTELTEYRLAVKAADGNGNFSDLSKAVKATTIADHNAPYAKSAKITDDNTITVAFSREVEKESAEYTDYYTVNYGVTVKRAVLGEDGRTVTLTVEGLDRGREKEYSLTVIGVKDTTYTGNRAKRMRLSLDSALYAYWPLNEGEGTAVQEQLGSFDSGKITDAQWTEGVFGSALTFDGTTSSVNAGNTDYAMTENSTVAFWVKPGELKGFNILLAKGPKTEGHFEIYTSDGIMKVYMPDCGDYVLNFDLRYYQEQWAHLAFVVDSERMLKLYVNGKVSGSIKIGAMKTVNETMTIGSLTDGSMPFAGAMDEIYLYTRALSEEEIQTLAGKGAERPLTDVVFAQNFMNVNLHDTKSIKTTFLPADTTAEKTLQWTSSDAAIVSVDENGRVTGLAYGTAMIIGQTADGAHIEKCFVTVGDFPEEKDGLSAVAITLICCSAALIAVVAAALIYKKKQSGKSSAAKPAAEGAEKAETGISENTEVHEDESKN